MPVVVVQRRPLAWVRMWAWTLAWAVVATVGLQAEGPRRWGDAAAWAVPALLAVVWLAALAVACRVVWVRVERHGQDLVVRNLLRKHRLGPVSELTVRDEVSLLGGVWLYHPKMPRVIGPGGSSMVQAWVGLTANDHRVLAMLAPATTQVNPGAAWGESPWRDG